MAAAPRDERAGPRPLRAADAGECAYDIPGIERNLTHFGGRISRRVKMRVAVEQLADLLQRLALQNRVPADLVGAGNGITLCDLGVFADEGRRDGLAVEHACCSFLPVDGDAPAGGSCCSGPVRGRCPL